MQLKQSSWQNVNLVHTYLILKLNNSIVLFLCSTDTAPNTNNTSSSKFVINNNVVI